MVLDSEEQRKNLLAIIKAVPVQGPVSQVRETTKAMDKLKAAIAEAHIAAASKPQTLNGKEQERCLQDSVNPSEALNPPAR